MSSGSVKHQFFDQLALVGKALGNGNRLELLEFLAQGPRNVDGLAAVCGMSMANTSQHLQRLSRAGLVSGEKEGQQMIYRLTDPAVVDLLAALRGIAEANLAELKRLTERHLKPMDSLEAMPARELLRLLRQGEVTVIDVRPPEEYAAGHVSGATNIPLADLEDHLVDPSLYRSVVAYCRGPYCALAYEAVAALRAKGITAKRLEDGFPEWKNAGLPVETGGGSPSDDS